MTFSQVKMEVTQTVTTAGKTERKAVGEVVIHVPTLDGLIADAVLVTDEKTKAPMLTDDGLPVYADDKHNFILNAIYAAVKAQARNKLVPKTTTLKDGAVIAIDWEGLTAESAGTSGIHLVLVREVKELFAKYIATLGKTANVQANITKAFNSPELLKASTADIKGKILAYVTDFMETLSEADQTKYVKYLTKVADAGSADEISADDY